MKLSVIIPTRNRRQLLVRCLESLCVQTADASSFEVLVIDNGSTDGTRDVVAEFAGRVPGLRHVWEPTPGLHQGRNRGLLEAQGELLLYGDDDIRATPTWIEAIQSVFQQPDVGLATGKALPDFETPPPAWVESLWTHDGDARWLGYFSVLDLGESVRKISPFLVWGCNFGIRKALLSKIGGFNPDGMPRELELYRGDGETAISRYVERCGLSAIYHPHATVHHWVSKSRLSIEYLRERARLQGISDSYSLIRARGSVSSRDLPRSAARAGYQLCRSLSKPLQRQLWQAYWTGFARHRRAAKRDAALRRWIVQTTYLEMHKS